MRTKDRGNILFLILLAVILFAALSFAVTSSISGGGRDASQEKLQSQVAIFQNVGMQIRSALQRMTVTGGYALWQIDFSKGSYSLSTANATCTSAACKLYDPAGGGVIGFILPASMWQMTGCSGVPAYAGRTYFTNVSVKGVGADDQRDLLIMYPGVSKALCMAVNDANGILNPSNAPPTDAVASNSAGYTGTLTQEVTLTDSVQLGDAAPSLDGKQMFCVRENTSCYFAYFVLVER